MYFLDRPLAGAYKRPMLGFGIVKLVFTIAVIVMIWSGSRWWVRSRESIMLFKQRRTRMARGVGSGTTRRKWRAAPVQETVRCASCGAYVPLRDPRSCGRDACPFPG
jgi:hypothetical protein